MRLNRLLSVLGSILMSTPMVTAQSQTQQVGGPDKPAANALIMTITAFGDGSDIPPKYTQSGDQTSPPISWINIPAGTITFLLHMHDVENSRNRTTDDQLHWLVWNIPGSATGLPEGVPKGAQLQNGAYQISASGAMYRGPGAPAADPRHHYVFELFALDIKIGPKTMNDPFQTRTNIMKAIQGHILGKAVYVGRFHRPQ
jgi:Raf kinase inhibitor-like YbhB/YbcL family protein